MPKLPEFSSVLDIRVGQDPFLDAWLLHFMTENNLEHTIDPDKNASPEQIRFMVVLDEGQIFAPCTDWMFHNLLHRRLSRELLAEYAKNWRTLVGLARDHVQDRYVRRRILTLCRHKFQAAVTAPILIPSRMMKRLMTIYLTQSGLSDPAREEKRAMNRRVADYLRSPDYSSVMNACPGTDLACRSIQSIRRELDGLELRRLIHLSNWTDIWQGTGSPPDSAMLDAEVAKPDPDTDSLIKLLQGAADAGQSLKILFLPSVAGSVMLDLEIIRVLVRQGHKVIMALKEGFYFSAPVFWDYEEDHALGETLAGMKAYMLQDSRVSKNSLLSTLRENDFVVISDGTRERLNLFRTNVTFARAWKEADLVLAKGEKNYRRLIQTSHSFTRDVFCSFRDAFGRFHSYYKPRHPRALKFSEAQILDRAGLIIQGMRQARSEGRKVMFYSAIIGSIPHQTMVAIQVLNSFVAHLRSRLEGTYIINPAEHFEEGMDGDDLMYMWEKVQRSGYIDIWRFQTDADIEKSFELMGQKVPPVWAGKDSTYSTGCTKEMQIALDMEARHPELQIIGPASQKFFRRREYGVGKFCDAGIECD